MSLPGRERRSLSPPHPERRVDVSPVVRFLPVCYPQFPEETLLLGLAQQFIPMLADHWKLSQFVHVALLPNSGYAGYTHARCSTLVNPPE
jgi:hypothetical protein